MSERGAAFDAAVVIDEAAQKKLLDLIDEPDYSISVTEYQEHLSAALKAQQREAMMAAWA